MPSAQYNVITAKIQTDPPYKIQTDPPYKIQTDPPFKEDKKDCEFVYKTEQQGFAGWQIVDPKTSTDAKEYQYFTLLKDPKGLLVVPKKIESKFNLVELKSHFSEARLVQLLEEKGIGRPSTFASLIDKIQEREYVSKKNISGQEIECEDIVLNSEKEIIITNLTREFGNEKNKLVINPLGIIVIEFLLKNFDAFFNYDYTREMENALDLIATNKKQWITLCEECNKELISITKDLKEEPKFSIKIDENHTLIMGKYGLVVKQQLATNPPSRSRQQATFLAVKKDLDITELQNITDLKLEDVIDNKTAKSDGLIGKYKGENLYVKKGKYGIYAQWFIDGNKETKPLKELDGKQLDQIEYVEVLRILEKDLVLDPERPVGFVRELSPLLSVRNGKFGDYIMYKKPRVKTPQFLKLKDFTGDVRKCDKDVLLNWIKLTYNIDPL